MANRDQKGFIPYVHLSGRPITTREVLVLASGAGPLSAGSFVKQTAAKDEWQAAAAGDAIDSLAMGFRYTDPTTGKDTRSTFLPSGLTYTHDSPRPLGGVYMTIVEDAFNCEYIGQLDAALTAPTTAETLNYDLVQTAADALTTGSGQEINAGSAAVASAQLRGIRYAKPSESDKAFGDDLTLTHGHLIVRINKSESDPAQTATAVGKPT